MKTDEIVCVNYFCDFRWFLFLGLRHNGLIKALCAHRTIETPTRCSNCHVDSSRSLSGSLLKKSLCDRVKGMISITGDCFSVHSCELPSSISYLLERIRVHFVRSRDISQNMVYPSTAGFFYEDLQIISDNDRGIFKILT